MKTGRIFRVLAAVVVAGLVGCDDSGPEAGDHTWTVSYSVTNTSSQAVVVELSGPVMQGVGSGEMEFAAGETREVIRYSEFLAPPPDAARDWWCVEVHRAQDGALVQQLCPVSNDLWTRIDPARFTTEFTLVISEEDLQPTVDHCPRLEGVVVAASGGDPIQGAIVVFDYGRGDTRYTNEQGQYSLWLPHELPERRVIVAADGYISLEIAFPAEVIDLGDNRYRLDVELERIR